MSRIRVLFSEWKPSSSSSGAVVPPYSYRQVSRTRVNLVAGWRDSSSEQVVTAPELVTGWAGARHG
ncbi:MULTISPECIES: hypothetical protein [Streptomyces]|uniref:hypothetical protein n=1 Tax=Streptomyces TaxID=1883 RepID=UPI0031F8B0AB|nr:hypothetical protein OG546_40330 [Streptomyces antimycoticus]